MYAAVSASGSYLLRAGEDGWQLMDTVEAFDLEGATDLYARPTSISRITAAAEGVTLFYGSDGALYLQYRRFHHHLPLQRRQRCGARDGPGVERCLRAQAHPRWVHLRRVVL